MSDIHAVMLPLASRPVQVGGDIRGAYKALIKKWHPDHFQHDNNNRKIAEERTMEITRAYKTLADYYRKHGSTPTKPTPAPAAQAKPPETKTPPEHTGQATAADVTATNIQSHSHTRSSTSIPVEPTQWKTIAILTVITLLLYFWFLNDPVEHGLDIGTLPNIAVQDVPRPEPGDKVTPHPADRFFTRGSKLGEVYAIQGIPSTTENGVWHYGKSRVYFVNGSVSRWDSHPDNPLNASLEIDPVSTGKAFIQRGSTKAEVRTIQGTPWRQTEREWAYGSSRILFSGAVVTGWEDSSLIPLKVQR